MRDNGENLDTILALLHQMETTLLGLKQLRGMVGEGGAKQMLEVLIEEAEAKIADREAQSNSVNGIAISAQNTVEDCGRCFAL